MEVTIKMIHAGNATVISSTYASGYFLHTQAPTIHDGFQGKPIKLVGNANNVQRELHIMNILIKNLKFLPFMSVTLPCDSEVVTNLTTDQLIGTPLEDQDEIFCRSLEQVDFVLQWHDASSRRRLHG